MILAILLLATSALATQETIQVLDESPLQRALDEIEQAEFDAALRLYPALTNNIDRETFFKAMLAAVPSLLVGDELPDLARYLRQYIQSNPRTRIDDKITASWKKELMANDATLFFAKRYIVAPPSAASAAAASAAEQTLAYPASMALGQEATVAYEAPMAPSAGASAASSSSSAASPAKDFTFLGKLGGHQTVPMEAARNPVLSQYLAKYPSDSIRLDAPRDVITLIVRALRFGQSVYESNKRVGHTPKAMNDIIVGEIAAKISPSLEGYLDQAIKQAQKLEAPLLVEAFTRVQAFVARREAEIASTAAAYRASLPAPPAPSAIAASSSSSSSAAAAASAPPLPIASSGHYYLVSKEGAKIPVLLDAYTKILAPGLAEQFAKGSTVQLDSSAKVVNLFASTLEIARRASEQAGKGPKMTGYQLSRMIEKSIVEKFKDLPFQPIEVANLYEVTRLAHFFRASHVVYALSELIIDRLRYEPKIDWKIVKQDIGPGVWVLARQLFVITGKPFEGNLGIPIQKIPLERLVEAGRMLKSWITAFPNLLNNPMEPGTTGKTFITFVQESNIDIPHKISALQALMRLKTNVPWDETPVRKAIEELRKSTAPAAASSSSSSSSAAAKK